MEIVGTSEEELAAAARHDELLRRVAARLGVKPLPEEGLAAGLAIGTSDGEFYAWLELIDAHLNLIGAPSESRQQPRRAIRLNS